MRVPVTVTSPSSVEETLALLEVELDGGGGVCANAPADHANDAINPQSRPDRARARTMAATSRFAKIMMYPPEALL
jgi:hypothetical protein